MRGMPCGVKSTPFAAFIDLDEIIIFPLFV